MTERVEDVIFEGLVSDDEFCRKVLHHLHADYFSEHSDQILFKEMRRFYEEHNKAPTKKILKLFVEDHNDLKQEEYTRTISTIDSWGAPEQNKEWLVKRTEQFCQEKSLFNAIMQSIQIMDGKSTKFGKDAIPGILSDALGVSFDKTIGHDYFAEVDRRYDFYHLKEDRIPFDLEMFNKITKGGIPKKTLSLALAGPNVGKSAFLCHHAASVIKQGKNALYITLEMAEERIAERIDCNLLDVRMDELYRMSKSTFDSKINVLVSKTHGRLVVKEYPTGGAHVGHFEALLDELKLKKNFVPDIIYVDYLNICASQKYSGGANWNSYFAIKAIAEELRAMAVKYDVPVFTASQVNRGGMNNTDIEMTDVSECILTTEKVKLRDGTTKMIGDLCAGDQITSNDVFKTVMMVHHKKMKECVKITLKSGKIITVSRDHKFPTHRGRVCVKGGLGVGDRLNTTT